MTDFAAALAALRRPRILVRAARCGLADYRRDRDLGRILRIPRAKLSGRALPTLIAEEHRLEANRTSGEATYNLQRHVVVLTALLAEAGLADCATAAS